MARLALAKLLSGEQTGQNLRISLSKQRARHGSNPTSMPRKPTPVVGTSADAAGTCSHVVGTYDRVVGTLPHVVVTLPHVVVTLPHVVVTLPHVVVTLPRAASGTISLDALRWLHDIDAAFGLA